MLAKEKQFAILDRRLAADGDPAISIPFAKKFGSRFVSHGLGHWRMRGTRAETGTRDTAAFGRVRTLFP